MNITKENISLTQLIALMINFLLGSSFIVGVGGQAEQNAWLAVGIATVLGLGIVYFFYMINAMQPNRNLFQIMEYCLTRPVAIFITFMYITYFLYISSRVIRDFGELISTAILPNTPIEVLNLLLMFVIAYIMYLGIEVLARTSEIFTPYLIGFTILIMIFLVVSGDIQLKNMQPILGDGIKPVWKALFPSLITFPFGELVTFTVIFCSVTNFKKAKMVSFFGVSLAGGFLVFSSFLMISTLGVSIMLNSNFPLLSVARLVSIGNFIERIDALIVFIMMLGVLVKSSVFLYCGLKGLEYVFNIPYRYFSLPISLMVSVFSILISINFADHLEEGLRFVPKYIHLPMQFAIPSMLMMVLLLKKRKANKKVGMKA